MMTDAKSNKQQVIQVSFLQLCLLCVSMGKELFILMHLFENGNKATKAEAFTTISPHRRFIRINVYKLNINLLILIIVKC